MKQERLLKERFEKNGVLPEDVPVFPDAHVIVIALFALLSASHLSSTHLHQLHKTLTIHQWRYSRATSSTSTLVEGYKIS